MRPKSRRLEWVHNLIRPRPAHAFMQGYWEPALRDLVDSIGEKFSAAFDRIGCAGEIKIAEHEDYDKWAIDIMVKFRDHEKLQLLTGERPSGGVSLCGFALRVTVC